MVEFGCEEDVSPCGWSVLPLMSPLARPFVVGASLVVEVPLGLASSEEGGGRFSERMSARRRLSMGPFEI